MIPVIPTQVVAEMAQRRRRVHQYLWHRLRKSWLRLTEDERRAIRDINPAWVPSRPALDVTRRPLRDNDSGEDFLFWHRRLIAIADGNLKSVGDPSYPRVEGWRRVPPPGDADYPVPDFPESELDEVKSARYFEQVIAPCERLYTDVDYLRGVTLGQLGSDLEFTIHGAMHLRWAAPSPVGYRPSTATVEEVGREWDAPAYDYLGDTYSSHVNPLFWKIHGWVEDRVGDWKRAHRITSEIVWKGVWVGPTAHLTCPHGAPPAATEEVIAADDVPDDMCRIDRIISMSAASEFDGFFRPPARRALPATPVPRPRARQVR